MSRRAKRWVLGGWAALVVAGGGLTLWLQDGTRDAPVSWQEVKQQRDVAPPGDADVSSVCDSPRPEPSAPSPAPTPPWPQVDASGEPHLEIVLCAGPE